MPDVSETESITGHTVGVHQKFREDLKPPKMREAAGRVERVLLPLDVVSGHLSRELKRVSNRVCAQFDLVLCVVPSSFAMRQTGQCDRQGEQVEKFAVSTLLIGGSGGIRFGHGGAPSIEEATRSTPVTGDF